MGIEFSNTPITWEEQGSLPSEELRKNGFQAGYKPAASTFNALLNNTSVCLQELQSRTSNLDDVKVDKVSGKGLSTNDYTNEEKTKLDLKTGLKTDSAGAEIFNDYSTNVASGEYSHAEGTQTSATSRASHAEGYLTKATGAYSHAEGEGTTASGIHSHAEGCETTASIDQAHAEGYRTNATKNAAHAEGVRTTASGSATHAEGFETIAHAFASHAEGYACQAGGTCSHASGRGTYSNNYQFVCGKFNKEIYAGATGEADTSGTIFMVGGGTSGSDRRNALRTTTDGKTYGLQNFAGSGADFAEMFEIEGGNPNNEDYRGYFVTTNENGKIRKATTEDNYILGVVSSTPTICGDVQSELWQGQYLTDVFGEKLVEVVEVEETTDEFGNVVPAHTEKRWILNPEYDPSQEYISREDRPEWVAVGLIGKLIVIDDGSCQVGGYCKVTDNGTATQAENGWKVLKRIDDTHIQILYR